MSKGCPELSDARALSSEMAARSLPRVFAAHVLPSSFVFFFGGGELGSLVLLGWRNAG